MSYYPSEKLNLLIDGTYFSNDICLIIYRDNQIKFTQLYRLSSGEYFHEIKEDLENLLAIGVKIESITCDGHRAILKAVKKVCIDAVLQRCTVHIQRECKIWLTTNPKSQAGFSLFYITQKLSYVTNHTRAQLWLRDLYDWHEQYREYINEKSVSQSTG